MAAARKLRFESLRTCTAIVERASSQKKLEESASADLLLATKNIAVVLMPLLVTMVLVAVFEVRSTRCACRHAWLSE